MNYFIVILIASNCWGYPFTLLLVQCVINDRSVLQGGCSIGLCPGKCVLAPVLLHRQGGLSVKGLAVVVLIHTVLEVLTGVSATGFLAGLGGFDDLLGVDHAVLQLKGLDKVGVPDHTAVRDLQVFHVLPQSVHLGNTYKNI